MKITTTREEYLSAIKPLLERNPTCIEIGVCEGHFSVSILNYLEPIKLYLIDPWEYGHDKHAEGEVYGQELNNMTTAYSSDGQRTEIQKKLDSQINSGQVVIQKGFSYDFVDSYKDNYFDFVYIDACHLYKSAKADLEMFLPKLKKNGLMCGHDYFNHSNFGVIQAVDEFCEEHEFEMIILNKPGWDWCLRRKING